MIQNNALNELTARKENLSNIKILQRPGAWDGLVNWINLLRNEALKAIENTTKEHCNIIDLHHINAEHIVHALTTPDTLELILSLHPCFIKVRPKPARPCNTTSSLRMETVVAFVQREISQCNSSTFSPNILSIKNEEYKAAIIALCLTEILSIRKIRYKLPSLIRRLDRITLEFGRPFQIDSITKPIRNTSELLESAKEHKFFATDQENQIYSPLLNDLQDCIRLAIVLYKHGHMSIYELTSLKAAPLSVEDYRCNANILYSTLNKIKTVIVIPPESWNPWWTCFPAEELVAIQLWLIAEAIMNFKQSAQIGETACLDANLLRHVCFKDGIPIVIPTDCIPIKSSFKT